MRAGRFSPDRRIFPALTGVLAMHLTLIALLNGARTTPHDAAPSSRLTLRLVPTALPPKPAPRTEVAPAPTPRRTAATRPHQRMPSATRDAHDTPPAAAASAPNALPSLLDSDATRRAIRASAHAPSLGDQLAQSRGEPHRPSASERLATRVHDAGKGDCAKGEYAGAGMGLLSLPFLAAAAIGGHCAK